MKPQAPPKTLHPTARKRSKTSTQAIGDPFFQVLHRLHERGREGGGQMIQSKYIKIAKTLTQKPGGTKSSTKKTRVA